MSWYKFLVQMRSKSRGFWMISQAWRRPQGHAWISSLHQESPDASATSTLGVGSFPSQGPCWAGLFSRESGGAQLVHLGFSGWVCLWQTHDLWQVMEQTVTILWTLELVVENALLFLVGGLKPSEKYESQFGWLFPIYGKIKNVPNHQPVFFC